MYDQSRIEEIIREAESFPVSDIKKLIEGLSDIVIRNNAMKLEKVALNRLHDRAEMMISEMNMLVGGDITSKSRKTLLVWGRYMVAYQLMVEGYHPKKIGVLLKKDRSTILHMKGEMEIFLQFPLQYPEERFIWKKFQEIIGNPQ